MNDTAAAPLWLCIHEVGHVVAHFALNEPLAEPETIIVSVSVDAASSDGHLGLTRIKVRAGSPAGANAVIRHLAGFVAENYWRYGRDWQPERADFGEHVHLTDIRRAVAAVASLCVADPAAEVHRLWCVTHGIIDAEWPGILAAAAELQARRTMTGAEIEAAWRGSRKLAEGHPDR
jgi:hypothetical protein